MHFPTSLSVAALAVLGSASAVSVPRSIGVVGSPQGFAKGTTGGAGGDTIVPTTNAELVEALTSDQTLTIVLTKTFDFTGTEGTTTATGCAPWGTAPGCQLAINANNWCGNYEKSAPAVTVTYDNAGPNPIEVTSNKSLLGQGKSGVIKGKGIRMANGVSNVIVQNIMITDLNPKYVWGGDAITLDGSDRIWIDHVTTSLIGRQHIVTGYNTNTAVTISSCDIDGVTDWSASCDGHHYWALYFTGKNDQITMKGNYIRNTSGRSPKLGNGVLLHALNNYWLDNSGHAFEGEGSYALVEGNVFQNVKAAQAAQFTGETFAPTGTTSVCETGLHRDCLADIYGDSPALQGGDDSFLAMFEGLPVAPVDSPYTAQKNVPNYAGYGIIA